MQEQRVFALLIGVVLDSQTVNYIHQYINDKDGSYRTTDRGIATHKLIKMIASYSSMGWDVNPFFYYIEAFSKQSLAEAFSYVKDFAESMLRLQSMDDKVFLASGKIFQDKAKMKEHARRHGKIGLQEAATKIANSFNQTEVDQTKRYVDVTYACLLQMGLLHRERMPADVKFEKMLSFFKTEIGFFPAREALLSYLHFQNKSERLVPIVPGAKNVRRKLLASAWDIFLLRTPEAVIQNESTHQTSIYNICTADRALYYLSKMLRARRVSSMREGQGFVPSSIGLMEDVLKEAIGDKPTNHFHISYNFFMAKDREISPIKPQDLSSLIKRLEQSAAPIVAAFH